MLANEDPGNKKVSTTALNQEVDKDELVKAALVKLKESKKNDSESVSTINGGELKEEPESKLIPDNRTDASGERIKERERGRERERERNKSREYERGRESDRERGREDSERDRDKVKERGHRSRDKGKDSG